MWSKKKSEKAKDGGRKRNKAQKKKKKENAFVKHEKTSDVNCNHKAENFCLNLICKQRNYN